MKDKCELYKDEYELYKRFVEESSPLYGAPKVVRIATNIVLLVLAFKLEAISGALVFLIVYLPIKFLLNSYNRKLFRHGETYLTREEIYERYGNDPIDVGRSIYEHKKGGHQHISGTYFKAMHEYNNKKLKSFIVGLLTRFFFYPLFKIAYVLYRNFKALLGFA